MSENIRPALSVTRGMPVTDGAGVNLVRVLGVPGATEHDPFLMLDEFGSDDPDDYIAGFPPHPHRGFETVTYMLEGRMRHEDSTGQVGELGPGSVQWMTAGSGVIHSEMPLQEEGRMHGFQLWVNLPAARKMDPPRYQNIDAGKIPVVEAEGNRVKVVAGTYGGVAGPVTGIVTDPLYLDVTVPPGGSFAHAAPVEEAAMLYLFEGEGSVAGAPVPPRSLVRFDAGSEGAVAVTAGADGARFLLLAGRPLREPVARSGPFVMNTREELTRAFDDYRSGRFTGIR